ncbi:MAG: polysaccharide biosynthesis tyrosine autokinase, partial [Acidobacteriaceae bacterium]|nr:polysaccharide biosynthesis tyrosine autokinase [Acidobacteriaceae bacterium]
EVEVSDKLPRVAVVVKPFENTRLVGITCTAADPALAAEYANRLASEFRDSEIEARGLQAQYASKWLNTQIDETRNALRKSEQELQNYSRRAGLMFTSDQQSSDQEKLKQLQQEFSNATADRISKQSAYEIAKSASQDSVPQVIDNDRLSGYREKLADLRREEAELRAELTPEHYKVKRVAAQIAEIELTLKKERENILSRMANDYTAARRRETLLAAEYSAQKGLVSQQTESGVYYDLLRREVESNRKLYDELLEKGKGAGLASAVRADTVRVIDAAEPAKFPYRPNLAMNFGIGAMAGLLGAVLLIIGSDYVHRGFRAPGETAVHLHLPELGAIPDYNAGVARFGSRKRMLLTTGDGAHDEGANQALVSWQNKPEIVTESFRSALASILLGGATGKRPRVILLTSASRGEGKTSTATNLSIAVSEINRRVLLIDADTRKPQLHHAFGVPNTWGLTDVLRERTNLADVPLEGLARETSIPNLYLLPSGPAPANIANLLCSERLASLIERVRTEFDTVVIDTPPMAYISDARLLAQLADAVVLVVRAGQTTREEALAIKERLVADGIRVSGTILNGWDPMSTARYGYYSYSSDPHETAQVVNS